MPMYDAPNAVEELAQSRKHPTVEKVEAKKDALKFFDIAINCNQKLIILQVFITPHRVLIKSSESLENKGFIAIITPYFFI